MGEQHLFFRFCQVFPEWQHLTDPFVHNSSVHFRLFFIAQNAPDLYGTLVVTGIFVHIALQVILNLCVVLNLMPTTGITLPFVSYGGTSILFLMAEMGIALSVSGRIQTTGEGITEAETA